MATKSIKRKKSPDQRFKEAKGAAALLKHAADASRVQIVLFLAEGERNVGALCDRLGMEHPAVSHHLALMRHAGIVIPRREGKNVYYSLTEKGKALSIVVRTLMG